MVALAAEVLLPRLGSGVVLDTVAEFEMAELSGASWSTRATSVKTAVAPGAIVLAEQSIEPPLPTAGVVQIQPAGAVSERNVVNCGRMSTRRTFAASPGPAFVTVTVNVTSPPSRTVDGDALC